MSPKTPPPALDDISKRIVELLQEDGRRPYAEIAREVGLSEAAARQRVQRLTESGLIQIVAVTDPLQLGFHRMSMIGIRVTGDPRAVAEKLTEITESKRKERNQIFDDEVAKVLPHAQSNLWHVPIIFLSCGLVLVGAVGWGIALVALLVLLALLMLLAVLMMEDPADTAPATPDPPPVMPIRLPTRFTTNGCANIL